jgi:hypothetical protein
MPFHAHFLMQASFRASEKIELPKERLVIGRSSESDIVIDEPGSPSTMGLLVHSVGEYFLIADSEKSPLSSTEPNQLAPSFSMATFLAFKNAR